MGIILPGLMFSVAEKLTTRVKQEDPTTPTGQISIEQTEDPTTPKDPILVLRDDGTVLEMDMNAYLTGVLLGEMPTNFDEEALKAQAVVARTYAQKRSVTGQKHSGAVCTDAACCQGYRDIDDYLLNGGTQDGVKKVTAAVKSTQMQVLTYNGALIEATYFSCSGGRTEDALAVWGTDIPYLQAVDSPGEENATHYTDSVKFTAEEFASKLGISPQGSPITWLGHITYTQGGGVDTMVIAGNVYRGTTLRQKLGLRSTAFSMLAVGNHIHVMTKGFGHRVGMSQYGAEAMAVSGSTYQEILAHYYPGTVLSVYPQN